MEEESDEGVVHEAQKKAYHANQSIKNLGIADLWRLSSKILYLPTS